jgi:probable HAF family extracellular repeat protein
MEPLGTLGGNNSAATGANNKGLIVGIAEKKKQDPNCISPQTLDYEAVLWWGKTVRELPPVPGDAIGAALAVNDHGQIVGGTGMCGSGPGIGPVFTHAVLWKNHLPTDLGNLGGALNNVAYAINNRGQVVGASDLAGDTTAHGFFWQKGLMTDLGTLPGDFSSFAFGINDRGQTVGQSCDPNFNCRAFLWHNGVTTDLNSIVVSSPLYLIAAADINSRGEIVGTGVDENTGEPLAFIAVPCEKESAVACGDQDAAKPVQRLGNPPKFTLSEEVRERLRRKQGFRFNR